MTARRLESSTVRARREGRADEGRARYQVYTDGGARPNPGPGGWGVVIVDRETDGSEELSGGEPDSTNNRMELTAAIAGLEHLPAGAEVEVHTDSTYVRQGITRWIRGWMARNWMRKVGNRLEPVKNDDLWRRLVDAEARHRVRWHWLKGHAGHQHNERADQLATAAIRALGGRGAEDRAAPTEAPPDTEAVAWIKVQCRDRRGAWAAILANGDSQQLLDGAGSDTTANRLELEAGLAVLHACPPGEDLTLHAGDYLRKGASEWLEGWKARGWKTGSGDAVKNRDLWEELDRALADRSVAWRQPDARHPASKELQKRLRAAAGPSA